MIDVSVNVNIFENLFTRFIDDEQAIQKNPKSNIELAKNDFFPKVKNYFTTNKLFSTDKMPKLLLPVTIDLFGKNELQVIGQFFDLDKNIN